jgi:hypothetical protein
MIPTVLMIDLHGEEGTHRHLRIALQGGDIPTVIYGIAWKIPDTHLRRRYLGRRVIGKAEAQLPNVSAGNTSM